MVAAESILPSVFIVALRKVVLSISFGGVVLRFLFRRRGSPRKYVGADRTTVTVIAFGLIHLMCSLPVAAEIAIDRSVLPEISSLTSQQLDALQLKKPQKDEYETSAEFSKRYERSLSQDRLRQTVFIPLSFDYFADEEAYEVSTCIKHTLSAETQLENFVGHNAMGAEWEWIEVTGRYNELSVTSCHRNLRIPVPLAEARAIRNDVSVVAAVLIESQIPREKKEYEAPSFGDRIVDRSTTYTYTGTVQGIFVGDKISKRVLSFTEGITETPGPVKRKINAHNLDAPGLEPIVKVSPIYPRRALSRGIEGFVVLKFNVNELGSVSDPEVVESEPSGVFDRAALQAIRKFKYKPLVKRGEPISADRVRYKMDFNLTK